MTRIYIITQVRSYGQALGQAIHRPGWMQVVGSCVHPAEVLSQLPTMDVDVVLLDASGTEGLWWVREIRTVLPSVRVVVMGLAEAEQELAVWAQAGVSGYLGCEAALKELLPTIMGVMRGPAVSPPEIPMIPVPLPGAGSAERGLARRTERCLTGREREILHLVGQGLSNEQIARRLYIALPTVKNHVHNILEKLGVHRRIDALQEIRRAGFVVGRGVTHTEQELPGLQAIST